MAFAKFFGASKKASPPKPEPQTHSLEPLALYPPRARNGLDPTKMDEFPRRLAEFRKAYMSQRENQRLGSLQIYRFSRIKLRLGRRWESLREKVFALIESAFARRLGSDDVYVAVSEEEYYVLITSAGRQDAELRGAQLATDITGKLLGTLPGGAAVTFKTMLFDFANGLDGVVTFQQLKARIEAFGRSIDDSERLLFLDNAHRFRVHYRPTINLQKSLIAAYDTLVRSEEPDGTLLELEAICHGSVNGVFDALLDTWMTQHAAEALTGPIKGTRSQIIIPVHYETLAAMRFRDDFLMACRKLPKSSSRQLVFYFCDLSPGVPQSRVRELSAYIRPFCSTIAACVPTHQIYTEHLENSGVKFAIIDVASLDPDHPSSREKIVEFVGKAKHSRIRTVVSGAWSVKLSHCALQAEVNYLNGDAFMKPVRQPSKVRLISKG